MKKITILLILILAMSFSLYSCSNLTLADVKENMYEFTRENGGGHFGYSNGVPEGCDFSRLSSDEIEYELEDRDIHVRLEGEIVGGYDLRYAPGNGDVFYCIVGELEELSDAKKLEERIEDTLDDWIVVRNGKIIAVGDRRLVNIVMAED